jgi:hypothetical protein
LAYCVERRYENVRSRLWPIAAASILASGINPNGFSVAETVLDYRRSPMTANLIEWMPPKLWGQPYGFGILICGAALVLIVAWRKVRPAHWILFLAFAAASLTAFRNIPLIGFLAPVLIAAYFPFRFEVPTWAPPVLAASGAIAVLGAGGFQNFRVAEWTTPTGAGNYLLTHSVTPPIFNTYEQGGYLIWRLWPQNRVFIDGRSLSENVYNDYHQILFNGGSDQMAGREDLLNRYGVKVVVMNTMDYVSGAMYPLALALANPAATEWDLVYEDTQTVIFARGSSAGPPLSNKLGRVLRHLDKECSAYIENSPDDPLCARTLGGYWAQNHVDESARRMLGLYLSHAKRADPQAERMLRELSQ